MKKFRIGLISADKARLASVLLAKYWTGWISSPWEKALAYFTSSSASKKKVSSNDSRCQSYKTFSLTKKLNKLG